MGGYLQYTFYEFATLGWIEETVRPLVQGITQAIVNAHDNIQNGSLALSQGELLNTNINRSPQSYLLNPIEKRSRYKYDVDKNMTVLSFRNENYDGLGFISWFAVHGVSVNNTNRLVNGDNKGYAAYLAEKMMNGNNGYRNNFKQRFIAAFAQSNEGDVSPNTLGTYCTGTDTPCDGTRDTKCPNNSQCVGRGPGWKISDLESNRIIGQNQAFRAMELYNARKAEVKVEGPLGYIHRYWNITKSSLVQWLNTAGTTDGPALNGFYQNTTSGTFGWNIIKDIVQKPSEWQKKCQAPKPILLDTGEIEIKHPWQPEILDIQLFRLGNVFIYAVPSEFTTMSGRILRESIKDSLIEHGLGNNDTIVIHSGPANGYASYCTTFEEYQHQRYEGASTPYGPYTLQAYVDAFKDLVYMMANPNNSRSNVSETLPDYTKKGFNFTPRYRSDQPPFFKKFGDVIKDISATYYSKSLLTYPYVISAVFVAGNPRNDPMLEGTFLTVEKKIANDQWEIIRTDNDYDTRFIWKYKYQLLGISEATVEWHINQDIEPGIYRLGYRGNSRSSFQE
ncbi:Neutral/alkaline nonlysosomal ceramidase [Mycotypha africana]|uniref:Neutral/alkaline nonlysosomal ceramidase n=1 Tax=Mycotypha africana TaxID=64632 RepID=UPI002300520D|nr:Neutral/alkaline nonlysosomal ceramidase [Mycotypha africana]KAI8984590.1 Neutral/alkaline nonlysosomal ceramidase [Mycotypha africana]